MPLVLVHNDVVSNPAHQWDDVEGVHYHYPSKYRRKIETGDTFVYYRGVHRAGGKRGPAEYVGAGRIGKIWDDPDRKTAWYCSIVDYERFSTPVAAKVEGVNREDIAANLWRDGVRVLDPHIYADIIAEGRGSITAAAETPKAEDVVILPAGDLVLPPALAKHQSNRSGYRRSKRSKAVGDWAERVALKYIQEQILDCSECVHRADIGETPGWDIDYRNADGVLQRVEVKGTVAAAFSGIEFTVNELNAAQAHGPSYWLCLVAGCETTSPKVQMIQDPAAKLATGDWAAKPVVFSIKFSPASAT